MRCQMLQLMFLVAVAASMADDTTDVLSAAEAVSSGSLGFWTRSKKDAAAPIVPIANPAHFEVERSQARILGAGRSGLLAPYRLGWNPLYGATSFPLGKHLGWRCEARHGFTTNGSRLALRVHWCSPSGGRLWVSQNLRSLYYLCVYSMCILICSSILFVLSICCPCIFDLYIDLFALFMFCRFVVSSTSSCI